MEALIFPDGIMGNIRKYHKELVPILEMDSINSGKEFLESTLECCIELPCSKSFGVYFKEMLYSQGNIT